MTYVYALVFMTSLNPRLTLPAIIPYLLLFFGIRRLTRTLMERSLSVQEGLGASEPRCRRAWPAFTS